MNNPDSARANIAKILAQLELPYEHGSPQVKELEATLRLMLAFAVEPYKEIGKAATAFLCGREFYIPGNEEAVKHLNHFREAAFRFEDAERGNAKE